MNVSLTRRVLRTAVACAIMLGSASCVDIDETLGGNFIPTDQIWEVFPCAVQTLEDITMKPSDSLSAYSTTRFTFGAVKAGDFTSVRSTSFTLVPLADDLDFGEDTEILRFHFTAVRDTLSTPYGNLEGMLQNVYVTALKQPLDSTVLYTGSLYDDENREKYLDLGKRITVGTPVYNGGDSLSFDFSKEYAQTVIDGIKDFMAMDEEQRDTLDNYVKHVPGVYIYTDEPASDGGRINMFDLPIEAESGYLTGNYAELRIKARYDGAQEKTDTSFIFYFGPSRFLEDDDTSYPTQLAFNASTEKTASEDFIETWENGNRENLYVMGGSGMKPVVKAAEIKRIIEGLLTANNVTDQGEVVINKATLILPFDAAGDYSMLDNYPMILSPTVKLTSNDGEYVSYAGLTDSSIATENQGDINRSTFMYCPDISHHVQEILKLRQGEGEDVTSGETDDEYEKRLGKYDIWMLIMHEEITETSSSGSAYDDYYNNLLYNSYYNNMMYDPYGYGYGYGGYGYGYGGYGYGGYSNYYNYAMMAMYASASSGSGTSTSSSTELDRDRFYYATLKGPDAAGAKPGLKITFSVPKSAER